MKNVIILGASGNIARDVIDLLVKNDDIDLTLFLRDAGNSDEKQKTRSNTAGCL